MPLFRWRVFATSEFHPPPSTCVEAMVLISRVFVVQKAKKLLARLSLLPSLKKVLFFAFKMCSQKRFRVFWRTHSLFIHFLIFKKNKEENGRSSCLIFGTGWSCASQKSCIKNGVLLPCYIASKAAFSEPAAGTWSNRTVHTKWAPKKPGFEQGSHNSTYFGGKKTSETHVFSANLLGLVIVIATSMSNDQQAGPYLSNLGSPGEENASKEAKDDPLENASCLHKPIEGQQGENENLQTDKIISV